MNKFWLTLFLITLFLDPISGSVKADSLTIAVITDLHYLSPELAVEGEALSVFERQTGRNVKDLHEVFDKVLDDLISEEVDILLVTGDITNHGERLSHEGFLEKILPLQESGTQVFVIPGNHDINIQDAKAYRGEFATPADNISKEEFAELYKSMGYDDALMRDDASLSYLYEIDEYTWLLAIDTNRYDEYEKGYLSGGRIKQQTMDWMLDILNDADSKGIRVLGVMHHGLLEHLPYQSTLFPDYLIEEWQKNSEILADAGLEIVFTGHFHSNDITMQTTHSGNTIYDVETASLAQYPFAYRIMKLSDTDLTIETRFVTDVPGNPDLDKVYRRRLETITRNVASSRLQNMGMPFSEVMTEVLTDLIVKLNTAHVSGDEKPDPELMSAVQTFAAFLGNSVVEEDYTFDFPPADNNLVIEFFIPEDN